MENNEIYEHQGSSQFNLDLVFNQDSSVNANSLYSQSIRIPENFESTSFVSRLTSNSAPSLLLESVNLLFDDLQKVKLKPISVLSSLTEVTLHSVFTSYVNQANLKIDFVKALSLREEFRLERILSVGADSNLDGILMSLGAIGRHCPELLIESLFVWRNIRVPPKANKEIRRHSRSQTLLADRMALTVDYILCRALISLLDQVKLARTLDQCGNILEDFAFNQLEFLASSKKTFQKSLPQTYSPLKAGSANHAALYKAVGSLISSLSNLRFASSSDRFIAELEKVPEDPSIPLENEDEIVLVLQTMKHLKLKIYPADSLEETAEFLLSCATFFKKTQVSLLKQTYIEAFIEILLPIIPVVVAEVNFPVWVKAVDILYSKASKLIQKTLYLPLALPFMSTIINVSQKETFQNKWFSFFELCSQKFKDRSLRPVILGSLSRLLWVFLFRYPDNTPSTRKKLDSVFRLAFSNRRLHDIPLNDLSLMVYYVVSFDYDYAMSSWISPLLSLESLNISSNYITTGIENVIPEKMTIIIRAFLLLASDVLKSARVPSFPTSFDYSLRKNNSNPESINYPDLVINNSSESTIATKFHGLLRILFESLDVLLPALELSYGSMLVNEEWCKNTHQANPQSSSISESLSLINQTRDLSGESRQTYPHLSIFHIVYSCDKQPFFDLIVVWLDALPLLVPPGFSIPRTIDWVIRLALHIDPQISKAAGAALNRLSCHLRLYIPILRALSKLIQKIKVQFIEVLAPIQIDSHHENSGLNLLGIFLTILQSWNQFLDSSLVSKNYITEDPDSALNWSLIEETEAVGLLFLCSTFVPARRYAIDILRATSDIERTYGSLLQGPAHLDSTETNTISSGRYTVIDILASPKAKEIIDSTISSINNSKIKEKGFKKINSAVLSATMVEAEAQEVWKISFPFISKLIFEHSPISTVLCRHMASSRLKQLHPHISMLSEIPDNTRATAASNSLLPIPPNEEVITQDTIILEQWGRYLTFVCSTITLSADSQPEPTYAKKKEQRGSEKINSAKELFRLVFVLLSCENRKIRTMVVTSLCHINHNIYRNFIEDLQPFVRIVQEDTKSRCSSHDFHNRRRQDQFREGIAECLAKTADIMIDEQYINNHEITMHAVVFIEDVYLFLSQPEVQTDWSWQELRIYFCDLVQKVYRKVTMNVDTDYRHFPFDLRHRIFSLAEQWCGHGPHRNSTRGHDISTMKETPEKQTDVNKKGVHTLEMESSRKLLELASLNLLALLCKGPIISSTETSHLLDVTFDISSLFQWIESVLQSQDRQIHPIGKEALESLLKYNLDNPLLYENVLHRCYAGDDTLNSTQCYFLGVAKTLLENGSVPFTNAKKVVLIAYKCGDSSLLIRKAACRLLRLHWFSSKNHLVLDRDCLCERIVHPLAAIYEQARTEVSEILAFEHPELVQEVFSELIMRLPSISESSLRSVFHALVPWVQALKLTLDKDSNEELSLISHGIITNMLYLVVKYSDHYPSAIELLWQALLSSSHNLSVLKAIINFLVQVNLEKRSPRLVFYSKNVFIYISHTQAGPQMLEYLMSRLTPISMIPEKKSSFFPRRDKYKHLSTPVYVINLDDHILTHAQRPAFSPGQLVLIFLSDIIISFVSLTPHLPLLLHLGACQAFDNGLLPAIVKNLTQPILPNLLLLFLKQSDSELANEIHYLVTDYMNIKLSNTNFSESKDNSTSFLSDHEEELSISLEKLVKGVISTLSKISPYLVEQWCEISSHWATVCPIRSVARASFTIYRSFSIPLRPEALVDIMTRLASTISDHLPDIQNFVFEILHSLESHLNNINFAGWELTPGFFWFLIGSLNTYNEDEYFQCLLLLKRLASQLTSHDLVGIGQFLAHLPDQLYIPNIEDVIILGLSSIKAAPYAYELLIQFLSPPLCDLIVDPSKLRLGILIHALPSLVDLVIIDEHNDDSPSSNSNTIPFNIDSLLKVAEESNCISLAKIISLLDKQKFRNRDICLRQLVQGIREGFFPNYDHECLQASLGSLFLSEEHLLSRRLKIVKLILSAMQPENYQMSDFEFAAVTPLIHLLKGPLANEALELIEDFLAIISPSKNSMKGTKLGLWKSSPELSNESNEVEEKIKNHLDETDVDSELKEQVWGVSSSENRQEATRLLLTAIASASSFNKDCTTSSISSNQQSDVSMSVHCIKVSNQPGFGNTLGKEDLTACVNSPYHPPKMTDFYVEVGSPRSYHHYTTSSNSLTYLIHQRQHSNALYQHKLHQNHSSVGSLTDICNIVSDPGELTELYSSITELDNFFTQLTVPDLEYQSTNSSQIP